MTSYLLPGKHLFRKSRQGGFDVLYRSFKFRVVVYRCWVNDRYGAEEFVFDLNAKLFSEFVDGNVGIEKKIKSLNKKINENRLEKNKYSFSIYSDQKPS